jgi:geranylgeranyl diphosphate synthase type II
LNLWTNQAKIDLLVKHVKFNLKQYLEDTKKVVDAALDEYLPGEDVYPQSLHKAMRYSVFSGGKRFRPILCISAFEACGGDGPLVMPAACATELIHTYSLIHDDLPCMDDDDVRRGQPTNHKVFGEAAAVLAGDALLTHAVELMVTEGVKVMGPELTLSVLGTLTRAIGSDGMVAGQVIDMESEGKDGDEDTVRYIHSRKTGALISAAAKIGALIAGADPPLVERVAAFGEKVGLAFQITDDILDAEGTFGALKSGSELDAERQKVTYPMIFGLETSKETAARLIDEAKDLLADLDERAIPLSALATLVIERAY